MSDSNGSTIRFTTGMTRATREFAKSKPWQGTVKERAEKFQTFHAAVIAENEMNAELVIAIDTITGESSGASGVMNLDENGEPTSADTGRKAIVMTGKLSVVTYLFLVGRVLGYDADRAMVFAKELFKQRFPASFSGCRMQGRMLVRS